MGDGIFTAVGGIISVSSGGWLEIGYGVPIIRDCGLVVDKDGSRGCGGSY